MARGTKIGRVNLARKCRHGNSILRPIERIVTSEDRIARDLFSLNTGGKFIKGPDALRNRIFAGASAGRTIGGKLGGGSFEPAHPTAGHVTQNGAEAPTYPH